MLVLKHRVGTPAIKCNFLPCIIFVFLKNKKLECFVMEILSSPPSFIMVKHYV